MDDPYQREEFLDAMSFAAFHEAHLRLSEEGHEVLKMMDEAATHYGLSYVQSYQDANGIDALEAEDVHTFEILVARMSLIEHFQKEVAGELAEIEEK